MSTPAIIESLKTWLTGEEAKVKAAFPAFEAAAVKDAETAVAEIEKYAGPLAVSLLAVAKQLGVAQLEAWATANLPILQAEILAGLAAAHVTGAAAAAAASASASAIMQSIVAACTAIAVVPK